MTPFRHGPKPVVGLVGAIGAGKSTVAAALARRGAAVIDGDALGHDALEQPAVRAQVLERWRGRAALVRADDGRIDRRALAAVVFADPAERKALEAIVFPVIERMVNDRIAAAQADPAVTFAVLDAAVMLEAGWTDRCDEMVYVDAPRAVRVARLAARSGWTDADLAAREAAQMPAAEKKKYATAFLVNDAGPDELGAKVDGLLRGWGWGGPPPGREKPAGP